MIILGQKYNFTPLELEQLKKKFNNIETVIYKDQTAFSVIESIQEFLDSEKFTLIVLNTKAKVDNDIIRYLTNLKFTKKHQNFKIIAIEHFLEKYLYKCYIPKDNNDLHYLDDIKAYSSFEKIQKKAVDVAAMCFLFLIYPFIKIITQRKTQKESPGSLYFKQARVGLNNKEFECIKFRSMYEDAEKYGAAFSKVGDSRIFPWGKTMRNTRIDEIPQIFNILKGEMSLIGPRPERRYWIEKDFENTIPYYNQRHVVKPGITGWAQVMYPYGNGVEDARQKLMYDLYYIKHWNLLVEFKVIWKTILVVLRKKGI